MESQLCRGLTPTAGQWLSFMLILFLVSFVVCYLWHMMGVTIGYHRLLSHRSFKCPKLVEYFWVLGGYLAFEGSPIWWATIHRAHHRYSDQPLDPHSPSNGLKYAWHEWPNRETYPSHIDPTAQSKDLVRDPVYAFLEQGGRWRRAFAINVAIGLISRLALWACFGWVVALASLTAGVVVQQIPLLLNVVCHIPKLGYKNFATSDDSVNVWWVALLTAGEGWHNNHHAFPGSARSGMRRLEFDLSWLTLRLMKLMGLVRWINEASIHSRRRVTVPVPVQSAEPSVVG